MVERNVARNENADKKKLTTRVLTGLRPEHFRLASDDKTRKAPSLWRARRELLMELKSYADPDGRNVRPAVLTLTEGLGSGRASIFRRLDELKRLGLIVDEDGGFNRPRTRRISLHRANELLGGPIDDRPARLPDFIPTELFAELVSLDDEDTEEILLDLFDHILRLRTDAPEFLLRCIKHSLSIGQISLDIWESDQYAYNDEACPTCGEMNQRHREAEEWAAGQEPVTITVEK